MEKQHIYNFQKEKLLGKYGGKGSKLVYMMEKGLPVPPFIVISCQQLQGELKLHDCQIKRVLSKTDPKNVKSIFRASRAIQWIIKGINFSQNFEQSVLTRVETTLGNHSLFSVRSSALSEDSKENSYAGILDSFLFISTNQLIDHIKKCLASFYSPRALKYKFLKGYQHTETAVAVIIQKMVPAVRSGVMFTMNPEGNLNENLIVAGYGQGEGIVKDKTETDSYWVDKKTQRIRKVVQPKSSYMDARKQDLYELRSYKVPPAQACQPVLSNDEIIGLYKIGEELENGLGVAQDIEFSIDKGGNIFLLQTRDITTIPYEEIKIVDNTNIVESYPGITLPLSFSFARRAYQQVFTQAIGAFRLSNRQVEELNESLANLLIHVKGRVYYNLHHWYKMVGKLITSRESLVAWERLVGIRSQSKKPVRVSIFKKLKISGTVLRLLMSYPGMIKRFFLSFDKEYRSMGKFIREGKSQRFPARSWWEFYKEESLVMFKSWATTIVNDFFVSKFYHYLDRMVRSYGLSEENNLTNDLLCGLDRVDSEKIILSFLALKDEVRSDNSLKRLFQHKPDQVLTGLKQNAYNTFGNHFYDFIEQYGDRVSEELKLETENLRTNPELLVSRIKAHLTNETTAVSFRENQQLIRDQAEKMIKGRQTRFTPKTILFKVVLAITRKSVRNRENMRFCRTRAYGLIKDIFTQIGQEMERKGCLKDPKDIFYLDLNRVEAFCQCDQPASLINYVNQQKKLFKSFSNLELPDRISYIGDKIPLTRDPGFEVDSEDDSLLGLGISKGVVEAKAEVILNPDVEADLSNRVLIARMTDPAWIFLMSRAKGLVSEKGSPLSHTAIIGRELGIPTIVGVPNATRLIKNGSRIRIDGSEGKITLLKTA